VTIHANTYTVGAAAVQIVGPSPEPQRVTITNLQPSQDIGEMSRAGYVFLAGNKFSIANNGSAHLQITTGSTGAQFEFYEIVATGSNLYAELLEGATFGSATAITAYNLDRTSALTPNSTLSAATAVSGGTVISAEYIPASNQAGGSMQLSKIHTLAADTSYVMRFTDVGGLGSTAFLQLGFSEQFNGDHDIHCNNTVSSAFVISGGQTWEGLLYAGEAIDARTSGQDCSVSVLRQDQV
jgi:hypothetical protein